MLEDDVWPVSVNDHLVEPRDVWVGRVARKHADAAPRLVDTGGVDAWQIGAVQLSLQTMFPSRLYRKEEAQAVRRFSDLAPACYLPADRLKAMDRDQVAAHALMPHICGFAGERLRHLSDPALWAECVRAYNDFLLTEFCAAAPERLAGVALLPLSDEDAMVAEIGRVAALGARAVSLPHDPAPLGLDTYHRPSWQRVFAAADDADLPVFIHIATDGRTWASPADPAYRPPATMVAAANFHVMETACDLAFSPILATAPANRRIVLLEANASWLPYIEERVDFATNGRPDLSPQGTRASELVRRHIAASFLTDPIGIADRHRIGIDRLYWQSDYPHADSLWPDSRTRLAALLADVPAAEARAIAAGNARRLLRLPA